MISGTNQEIQAINKGDQSTVIFKDWDIALNGLSFLIMRASFMFIIKANDNNNKDSIQIQSIININLDEKSLMLAK
jgi:hypothetical protein